MDHRGDVQDGQNLHILTGKDTIGSVLLLKNILGAQLDVRSMVLTKKPSGLISAEDVDMMSAPFRVTFVGTAIDLWESSSIERLYELPVEVG